MTWDDLAELRANWLRTTLQWYDLGQMDQVKWNLEEAESKPELFPDFRTQFRQSLVRRKQSATALPSTASAKPDGTQN